MTVSVVGSDSGSGYLDHITLTVPATAVSGDRVIAAASTSRWPGLDDPPELTEITEVLSGTNSSTESSIVIYEGTVGVDVSPGQTIDFGNLPAGSDGSDNYSATLICLTSSTGATLVRSPATFGDGVASLADPGDTAPTAPSIPLTADGVLIFLGSTAADAGTPWTAPVGYTDNEETSRVFSQQQLAHKTVTGGGTSGAATATLDVAEPWNAIHILITEADETVQSRVRTTTGTWIDATAGSVWDGTAWIT